MPELPEVEAVARTLRPVVARQSVRCVHVFHPIATKPQPSKQLAILCQGQAVKGVSRRGKYLFLELRRGLIEMHFRFDGQLIWFSNARQLLRKANAKPDGVHVDVAFEFSNGVLAFADRRHFGRVHAWESRDACTPLRTLGVDALSREFTASFLETEVKSSRRALKELLLDQSRIAGIGNIYSCEALWRAALDPRRPARSLNRPDATKLHKAIVSVLQRALECCLDPAPTFCDPAWWFQDSRKSCASINARGCPAGAADTRFGASHSAAARLIVVCIAKNEGEIRLV